MGQLLCLAMIAGGVGLLIYIRLTRPAKTGDRQELMLGRQIVIE